MHHPSRNQLSSGFASPCHHLSTRSAQEGIPTAGSAQAFQFKVRLTSVGVFQRPAAFLTPFVLNDLDRLGETLVARRLDRLEVIQSTEDIVVPARGEREAKEDGFDNVVSSVGAK